MTPIHAEEAVLGGLLLDNTRFHDVAPLLSADQFTSNQRSRIFIAIRDRVLAGEEADTVTIGELLPDDFDAVLTLTNTTPGASAIVTYAGIVRENWRRREAVSIADRADGPERHGDRLRVHRQAGDEPGVAGS
jgi:replicative DNA helicase